MKRLNPRTNRQFVLGDVREDGRLFWAYVLSKTKDDGHFQELWLNIDSFIARKSKKNRNKTIWFKNNPDKKLASVALRRAKKLQAAPSWLSKEHKKEILEFYKMAKELESVFPWKQHVDHIVPLSNSNVSGLHVPWNLQILSQKSNLEKSNTFTN